MISIQFPPFPSPPCRSPDDIEGHSIVLLGYSVESVQEKQAYVFKLSTEGVGKDILFAAENEEEFLEWWNRYCMHRIFLRLHGTHSHSHHPHIHSHYSPTSHHHLSYFPSVLLSPVQPPLLHTIPPLTLTLVYPSTPFPSHYPSPHTNTIPPPHISIFHRLDSATKAYDQEMDDGFAYEWMNRKNEELSTSMNSTASADVS